jgi:hypothetical protein
VARTRTTRWSTVRCARRHTDRTALSAPGSCQPQLAPVASVVVMLARSYWLGARPFFGPGSVFAVPNGLTDVVRASVQRISGKLARTMANVPEEHPKPEHSEN